MKIIAICGSSSANSSNYQLLLAIKDILKTNHEVIIYDGLRDFDLFTVERLKADVPDNIKEFKKLLSDSDFVIISTPEYTHNIPAVVKNMIEWCTDSGEFNSKPVLPITFTPKEPRGKYAMESLLNSLKTMNARIVVEFPLYKTDVEIEEGRIVLPQEIQEMVVGLVEG